MDRDSRPKSRRMEAHEVCLVSALSCALDDIGKLETLPPRTIESFRLFYRRSCLVVFDLIINDGAAKPNYSQRLGQES